MWREQSVTKLGKERGIRLLLRRVIMGGNLVKIEPNSTEEIEENGNIWKILYNEGIREFMHACRGFDHKLLIEVVDS